MVDETKTPKTLDTGQAADRLEIGKIVDQGARRISKDPVLAMPYGEPPRDYSMPVIYKNARPFQDFMNGGANLTIPGGAILSVGRQGRDYLSVWYLHDHLAPLRVHHVEAFMTGVDLRRPIGRFLGTVLFDEGAFVLHVFERSITDR